jgi:hypothetical protein
MPPVTKVPLRSTYIPERWESIPPRGAASNPAASFGGWTRRAAARLLQSTETENQNVNQRDYFTVTKDDVSLDPFPHVFKQPFLQPELFRRLKAEFPPDELFDGNSSRGGRAGRDLYPGDEPYARLLESSPAWREFANFVDSPGYVDLILELFGDQLANFGCLASPERIRYRHHIESRDELAEESTRVSRLAARIRDGIGLGHDHHDPNDVFVRMDIGQGAVGYAKPVHCDRSNRLSSMLIYFCDKQEIGMEGGNLRIHKHKAKKAIDQYERHPKEENTIVVADIEPRENLGGMFIGCNISYHSATAVTRADHYRNFVYTSVASRSSRLWRS